MGVNIIHDSLCKKLRKNEERVFSLHSKQQREFLWTPAVDPRWGCGSTLGLWIHAGTVECYLVGLADYKKYG